MTKAKAENQLANTPTGSGGVVAIMGRVKFLNDELTTVAAHRLCYRNTTTVSDGVGGTIPLLFYGLHVRWLTEGTPCPFLSWCTYYY